MRKRILSAVLTAGLLLTMLPTVAFADDVIDSYEKLATALNAGSTVTLGGDIIIEDTQTLDLTGKTINTAGWKFVMYNGGNLTISGNGTVKNEATARTDGKEVRMFEVSANSQLTIKNGTFDSATAATIVTSGETLIEDGTFVNGSASQGGSFDGYSVMIAKGNGVLTFEKGSLTATQGTDFSGMTGVYARDNGTIILGTDGMNDSDLTITTDYSAIGGNNGTPTTNYTIYGGKYTIDLPGNRNPSNSLDKFNTVVYMPSNGTYDIHGGIFNAPYDSHVFSLPYNTVDISVNIDGGTFTANDPSKLFATVTGSNINYNFTGGTYDQDPTSYVADGYMVTGSGPYEVVKVAAKIGTTNYASLTDAVTAATDGATITLTADNTDPVAVSKSLTIEASSYSLGNVTAGTGYTKSNVGTTYAFALDDITVSTETDVSTANTISDPTIKSAVDAVLSNADVNDVPITDDAENAIIAASGLTSASVAAPNTEVKITIDVAITAKNATATSLTFGIIPTAKVETVTGGGAPTLVKDNIPVPDSYLAGNPIQVTLPVPSTMTAVVEVRHHRENGSIVTYTPGASATTKNFVLGTGSVSFLVSDFSDIEVNSVATVAATIGSNNYASLQDAIDAAKSGDAIVLTNKATATEAVTVSGKSLTIDKTALPTYDFDKVSVGTRTTKSVAGNVLTATYTPSSSGGAGGAVATGTYKLTFNTNGGSSIASKDFNKDEVVKLSAYTPTRDGYTFAGWYSDSKLSNKVTTVTMTKSMTVYAAWTEGDAAADVPSTFTDVKSGDWFYDDVENVVDLGLMNGLTDTTFGPNQSTTRAMVVTMLYRLEKQPAVTGATVFTDVAADGWYTNAVIWATQNGIAKGTSPSTFEPNAIVTRQQLAAFLYRYCEYKGADVSNIEGMAVKEFTDWAMTADYAQTPMRWAFNAGIVTGKGNGLLDPAGNATRAELATMFVRMIENSAKA